MNIFKQLELDPEVIIKALDNYYNKINIYDTFDSEKFVIPLFEEGSYCYISLTKKYIDEAIKYLRDEFDEFYRPNIHPKVKGTEVDNSTSKFAKDVNFMYTFIQDIHRDNYCFMKTSCTFKEAMDHIMRASHKWYAQRKGWHFYIFASLDGEIYKDCNTHYESSEDDRQAEDWIIFERVYPKKDCSVKENILYSNREIYTYNKEWDELYSFSEVEEMLLNNPDEDLIAFRKCWDYEDLKAVTKSEYRDELCDLCLVPFIPTIEDLETNDWVIHNRGKMLANTGVLRSELTYDQMYQYLIHGGHKLKARRKGSTHSIEVSTNDVLRISENGIAYKPTEEELNAKDWIVY